MRNYVLHILLLISFFFEKSNIFGINWEKPIVRGHDRFEEEGASGDKNQSTFFCTKWGFENFSFNNLKTKQNNIFRNNSGKIIKCVGGRVVGRTIFEGLGCWMTKMNITFSVGNRVTNTVFKFFPQKNPDEWKPKNQLWGQFPAISVILFDNYVQKQ